MENNEMINGVIPINKPRGMTSHDVVAKLRKILKTKRVGHTGTLDPEVSGVLPICIGNATRISEYIMEMSKTYIGQLTLGTATDTQDFTGEIIERKEINDVTVEQIRNVMDSFKGEIEQIPPMYSSVKVKGKRLYELAREGKEIKREPRKVTIYDIILLDASVNQEHPTADFNVSCSKGTYIRTLCVDIGKRLGFPAHMSKLTRTKSGSFLIDQSFTIEEVENCVENGELDKIIVPMAKALPNLEEIVFTNDIIETKIYNGQRLSIDFAPKRGDLLKIVDQQGNLVAIYEEIKNTNMIKPVKVFKQA